MKPIWVILILLSIFLSGCDEPPRNVLLVSGDYAVNNNWEGRWKVVNIWAEWCKPCWEEIPELNLFHLKNKEGFKGNKIQLVGFNYDELSLTELKNLRKKMSINFPVITQWPKEWPSIEIKGLPATLIIAPDNKLASVLWGPQDLESLNQSLEQAQKSRLKF